MVKKSFVRGLAIVLSASTLATTAIAAASPVFAAGTAQEETVIDDTSIDVQDTEEDTEDTISTVVSDGEEDIDEPETSGEDVDVAETAEEEDTEEQVEATADEPEMMEEEEISSEDITLEDTTSATLTPDGNQNIKAPKVQFVLENYPEYAGPGILSRIIASCYKTDKRVTKYQLNPGDVVYAYNSKGNRGDIIRITGREEADQMWGLFSFTIISYKSLMDGYEDHFNTDEYEQICYYRLKRIDNLEEPAVIDSVKLTGNLLNIRRAKSFGRGYDECYDYSEANDFISTAKTVRNAVKTGWVYDYMLRH